MSIALYHFHVTQIKRSAGQSAIASAAYRSGEKLHSEYYGEDNDYTKKGGVICSEILLPPHAPFSFSDRETLWNEVEKAENERKLTQLQHKKQQLENRITYYEKGDRRKRAHHLITRGAAIESVAPLTKVLSETEFYTFAEKVFSLPEIKGLLMQAINEHNIAEQKEW